MKLLRFIKVLSFLKLILNTFTSNYNDFLLSFTVISSTTATSTHYSHFGWIKTSFFLQFYVVIELNGYFLVAVWIWAIYSTVVHRQYLVSDVIDTYLCFTIRAFRIRVHTLSLIVVLLKGFNSK